MPFMKAYTTPYRFGFSTALGEAWFDVEEDGEIAVLERVTGVYEKQTVEERPMVDDSEPSMDAVRSLLDEFFDDDVYRVVGEEVPIHCPEMFVVGRGRISGVRVYTIPRDVNEKAGTFNIPTRYVSPGAMSWPVEWLVIAATNGTWIIHYQTLLGEYRVDKLVDKGERGGLCISLPRDKVVRLE